MPPKTEQAKFYQFERTDQKHFKGRARVCRVYALPHTEEIMALKFAFLIQTV